MQVASRIRPKTFRLERLQARDQRARERLEYDLRQADLVARRLGTDLGTNPHQDWLDKIGASMGFPRQWGETDDQFRTRVSQAVRAIGNPPSWVQQPPNMMVQPGLPNDWWVGGTAPIGTTTTAAGTTVAPGITWTAADSTLIKTF